MLICNKINVIKELLTHELEELEESFEDTKHNIKIDFGIDNKEDLEWMSIYADIYFQLACRYFGRYSKLGKKFESLINKIETQYNKIKGDK